MDDDLIHLAVTNASKQLLKGGAVQRGTGDSIVVKALIDKKEMAGVFVRRALEKALATIRQLAKSKPAAKTTKKTVKKRRKR